MSEKKLTASKKRLESLYKKHSAVDIAKMYGVTSGAVYAQMKKMGIPRRTQSVYQRTLDPIPKPKLQEFYEHMTTKEIAELHGVSQEWVRKLLVKYGIEARPATARRTFEISKERLQALYSEHSLREIAFMFGVGETVVFKRVKEYGIKLDENHRERKGKVFSEEHRKNLQLAQIGLQRGEKNPNWKGGVTPEHIRGRARAIYGMWKKAALKAANSTCQRCGAVKGAVCECCGQRIIVHVHHKEHYAKNPELRYAPENAEVLCAKCHHEEHTKKTA